MSRVNLVNFVTTEMLKYLYYYSFLRTDASGNIIVYKIKIMDLNKDIQRLVKELRYLMKENFNSMFHYKIF